MGSAHDSPVSTKDFSDKCRICLKRQDSMTDIFESGISNKIIELINVKIASNDKLPKKMCQDCTRQLNEFYRFQNLAKDSDNFLRALLLAEQSYNTATANHRMDKNCIKKSKLNKSCKKRNDCESDNIYLIFVTSSKSDSSPKNEIFIRDLNVDDGNVELTDFCRSLIKNGSENPIYLNKHLGDCFFQVKDSFQSEDFAKENHDENTFSVNMFIYFCKECKETFESEDCLTEHLICCQNNKTPQEVFKYVCPVCTICESDKHLFLNHLNTHKKKGISFMKVDKNLKYVSLTESEEEIFINSIPNNDEPSMKRKILKINMDYFKCFFCSEPKSADNIKEHIKLCFPGFQEDDYFSLHIKYSCPVCSASWVDDSESYYNHLLSHKEEDDICFVKVDISGQLAQLTAEDVVCTPFEKALDMLTFNGDESSISDARLVKMRGLFSCQSCDFEGDSLDLLFEHYLEVHDGKKPKCYICPVCDKEFKVSDFGERMPYHIHMRKHKEDGIYFLKVNADGTVVNDNLDSSDFFSDINDFLYGRVPCPELELIAKVHISEVFVEKITHSRESFVEDELSHFPMHDKEESKGNRDYICEKCGKKCFGKGNYKRHFLTHSNRPEFSLQKRPKCSVCDKTFSNRAALNEHSKHHENEQVQVEAVPDLTRAICEICGKRLSNKASLAKHSKMHANNRENKLFKCNICERGFRRETSLKRHLSAHFNPNYFECEECKLPLPSLASLGRHKLGHRSSSNTFDCKVCKISFLTKERLAAHETHTGHHQNQKRFECNVCHEKFFIGREFIKHIKLHPKYKMSECTLCGKRLSTMQSLGLHLSRHFESNSILCPQCGKQCFEERNYRRHLLTHKGIKPFRCDVEGCEKSFYTYFEVNRHKKYHNNTRDFSCPYCPKSFHEANHLKVHIRTHTGERPYTCPHCGKSFVTRTRCKQHISLIHQGIGYDLIQSNITKKVPVFEALETVA